ncbi:hypothetical protein J4409_01585 [Candidatus Woesearchaeota archaeon]|nr:hypothetical protein [Candidatus Woesearchaeota archaeon]
MGKFKEKLGNGLYYLIAGPLVYGSGKLANAIGERHNGQVVTPELGDKHTIEGYVGDFVDLVYSGVANNVDWALMVGTTVLITYTGKKLYDKIMK